MLERIEADPEDLYFAEHLARYDFAARHLHVGVTLDVATGTGYGAAALAASKLGPVVGVDLSSPTLLRARRQYTDRRLTFVAANGVALPFRHRAFANVVSLETIEHIAD